MSTLQTPETGRARPWAHDRTTRFYLLFGLLGLSVVAVGFGITYVMPMVRRSFAAPWIVHLHGAAAVGWILLLIAQARLVRGQALRLHRQAGKVALPLALVIWSSGIATATWAAHRDLPQLGTAATSSLAGTINGLTLFLLLVLAALVMRGRPDWHKRLVVLATIQLLWPAFFRLRHLFPDVPDPELWFGIVLAYSPILVAALRDFTRFGKIHPVWSIVGPALVAEQSLELAFFDQGFMRDFGQWAFTLLG